MTSARANASDVSHWPAAPAEVLLDGDSLSHMTPLSLLLTSVAQTMPRVLEADPTCAAPSPA